MEEETNISQRDIMAHIVERFREDNVFLTFQEGEGELRHLAQIRRQNRVDRQRRSNEISRLQNEEAARRGRQVHERAERQLGNSSLAVRNSEGLWSEVTSPTTVTVVTNTGTGYYYPTIPIYETTPSYVISHWATEFPLSTLQSDPQQNEQQSNTEEFFYEPKFEELFVGYECQILWTPDSEWEMTTLTLLDLLQLQEDWDNIKIRTLALSELDFIVDGWEPNEGNNSNSRNKKFRKGDFYINFNIIDNYITMHHFSSRTGTDIIVGKVHLETVNEFRKLFEIVKNRYVS